LVGDLAHPVGIGEQAMTENTALYSPHLEGEAFFWPAGPVGVLLSHGVTATTAEIRPLAQRLHEAGYAVAGPLLPGHGTTPDDLNRARWQDWARAAEGTLQQLAERCERVIVGGESMGAVAALYLASELPEAVGVLAYAPAIKLNLSTWDRFRLRLLAPIISSVPKRNWSPCEGHQAYRVTPLRAGVQSLNMQKEVLRRLPQIRQPVLVVQGCLDRSIDPHAAETIRQGVSSAVVDVHWLEHSAHTVLLDREFDQVVELTLRFVDRVLQDA
jgi:carboxylesterase